MPYDIRHKIAFITGASSGIGQAAARAFAAQGVHVIITARRVERLEALATELRETHSVNVLPLALDVRNRQQVEQTVAALSSDWQNIDILLNNAGLSRTLDKIQDGDPDNWDAMIDTNVKGLLYVTRAILPGMIDRQAGHVINLGSVAGRWVYHGGNVYCASKHAVKAINESLRLDLKGHPIRVSTIDPGAVETEFSLVRLEDQAKADAVYQGFTPLAAEDVADAILYCATRPLHVDVAEVVLCSTEQVGAAEIHRR